MAGNAPLNRLISTIDDIFAKSLGSDLLKRSRAVSRGVMAQTIGRSGSRPWARMATYGGVGAGIGGIGGYATSDNGDGFGGTVRGTALGVLGGGAALLGRGMWNSNTLRSEARGVSNRVQTEWAERALAGAEDIKARNLRKAAKAKK